MLIYNNWKSDVSTLYKLRCKKIPILFYSLSDEKKSVVTMDNSGRQLLEYEDVILDEDSTLVIQMNVCS